MKRDAVTSDNASAVRLKHHIIVLDDGHRVGVTLGGSGVPFVFLHGLALDSQAYQGMLSRVASLGFMVVAIDAAGHGRTHNLRHGRSALAERVLLTMRVLDALGVRRAVLAGHSLGGRLAMQLAAACPDRVLALVLLNPAAGAGFDQSILRLWRSPAVTLRTFLSATYDLNKQPLSLDVAARQRYGRVLAKAAADNLRRPAGAVTALLAMMQSGDHGPFLRRIREHGISTVVLHGEKDQVVPFENAIDIAIQTNASLYRVQGGFHLWMLANPQAAFESMRHLLDRELGEALNLCAATYGVADWRSSVAWGDLLIDPMACIARLNGPDSGRAKVEERPRPAIELVRQVVSH